MHWTTDSLGRKVKLHNDDGELLGAIMYDRWGRFAWVTGVGSYTSLPSCRNFNDDVSEDVIEQFIILKLVDRALGVI